VCQEQFLVYEEDPGLDFGLQITRASGIPGSDSMPKKTKNPHAVALGRLGGLKGGKARTSKLTAEERRALARKAVLARWAKAKKKVQQKEQPPKP
jgi:hypothetical protein